MMHSRLPAGLLFIIASGLAGCGGPTGPQTAAVSGQVTLDAKPLEKGTITFFPADGAGPTAGASITNGAYSADVTLGEKRVEIRAPRVVGQRNAYEGVADSPKIDIVEELVPTRYNALSELKAKVAAGKNAADFKLESPPSK